MINKTYSIFPIKSDSIFLQDTISTSTNILGRNISHDFCQNQALYAYAFS